jgi:hypothetical protein
VNAWLRFWDGVSDDDRKAGERARTLLARLERLEPQSTTYYAGIMGGNQKEVSYIEWCRTGSEGVGISMRFGQGTPDGELLTRVWWESLGFNDYRTAGVRVSLQEATLEGYYFFEHENSDPRGAKNLRARVNRHAVAHIHDWLERRAPTVREALDAVAAHRARLELQERERQERESHADALRKKYLS